MPFFSGKLKEQLNELTGQLDDLRGMLSAIDRSMAMIQFTPDGIVTNVNENFLRTMAYPARGSHRQAPSDILRQELRIQSRLRRVLAKTEARRTGQRPLQPLCEERRGNLAGSQLHTDTVQRRPGLRRGQGGVRYLRTSAQRAKRSGHPPGHQPLHGSDRV
ncbi:hypothetical protein JOS77_24085 [Chromobacterium haemolyticum]|nr:hypothetical protein JOS77_24085 [Chromobacterium haemolyticum]